jgi:hypothetical protein
MRSREDGEIVPDVLASSKDTTSRRVSVPVLTDCP